ncbi:TLC domain-containing protein 2 [Paroedura picta]|uniref:TLC domain-containing protein 2 n=1 Tax=Paroedura picta TaxID=143630 RepID=UPI0040575250
MELLVLGGSAAAFRLLNAGLDRLLPPGAQGSRWDWRNTWTSLVHSLLSGAGALLGFYLHPQMAQDPIGTHLPAAHRLLGVSVGYFVQDFIDMLFNQKFCECWELLFHHSVVIVCLGFAFVIHHYIGFAMVALLVEINSVFLHLRSILQMAGLSHTPYYRVTSLVNLSTYVVFRLSTLAWMTRWLVLNWENIPLATYMVGVVGMAIMIPMNIVLFCRLLRSDCLKSGQCDKDWL